LVLGNLGLAYWLEQYKPSDFTWIIPGLLESALYASLGVAGLEVMRDFAEHPFPVVRRAETQKPSVFQRLSDRLRAARQPLTQAADHSPAAVQSSSDSSREDTDTYSPMPVPPDAARRKPKKQPPDDIIKIELD